MDAEYDIPNAKWCHSHSLRYVDGFFFRVVIPSDCNYRDYYREGGFRAVVYVQLATDIGDCNMEFWRWDGTSPCRRRLRSASEFSYVFIGSREIPGILQRLGSDVE